MAKKKVKQQQQVNDSANLEWLPAAIKAATKATKFCVAGTLHRKRRPYALEVTKTTSSFERAVEVFEENRELLQSLPPVP